MAISIEQFIAQTASSGLLPEEELRAAQAALPPENSNGPDDPAQPLARELVRGSKLTAYQAQTILHGGAQSLVLGNYVILEKLGEGGMGMVLKARHKRMDRLVALKVLSPKAVEAPDAAQRFQREVQAAARLHHPHIVTAFDADEARGTHFFAMEYVEGSDLYSYVKQHGPLPPGEAIDCIMQAARGLEYAHLHGVVHRDIKPANLLLSTEGTVKILDMGLARLESVGGDQAELTGTGQIMGTVDYMAPEQAVNTKHADHRADIYSLGITLWYLLTGKAAYGGDTAMEKLLAHREQPIPSLLEACPDASPQLDAIFQRMVAKRPADRYQTIGESLAELTSCRAAAGAAPTIALGGSESSKLSAAPLRSGAAATLAKPATKADLDETFASAAPSGDTDPTTNVSQAQSPGPSPRSSGATSARPKRSPAWLRDWRVRVAGIGTVVGLMLLIGVMLVSRPADRLIGQKPPEGPDRAPPNSAASPRDPAPPKAAPEMFALELDGNSYVEIPTLKLPTVGPFTIEGFVTTHEDRPPQYASLVSSDSQWGIHVNDQGHWTFAIHLNDNSTPLVEDREPIVKGQRLHLAGVRDLDEMRVYVNGRLAARRTIEPVPLVDATLDANCGRRLRGQVDELRISQTARYQQDFAPPPRFEPDEHTVALYHCDEAGGDLLIDSSANKHHGKVFGAKWAPVDEIGNRVRLQVQESARQSTPGAIDLIAAIDLTRDVVAGEWKREGGSLLSPTYTLGDFHSLRLPVDSPPEAYELSLDLTRTRPGNGLQLGLVAGGQQVVAIIDGFGGRGWALQRIDGKTGFENGTLVGEEWLHLKVGAPRTIVARVQPAKSAGEVTILLEVDGRPIMDWTGAASRLSGDTRKPIPGPPAFYLGSQGDFSIRKLELRPLQPLEPPAPPPQPAGVPPAGSYALEFDGEINPIRGAAAWNYDGTHPLTIEAWIHHHPTKSDSVIAQWGPLALGVSGSKRSYQLAVVNNDITRWIGHMTSESQMSPGKWVHLAGQWTGERTELYLDGVPQVRIFRDRETGRDVTGDELATLINDWSEQLNTSPLTIGGPNEQLMESYGLRYTGLIRAVRISDFARYKGWFRPATQLDADVNTLALYKFQEGQGNVLIDSSGNQRHATIVNAKWVPAVPGPADWRNIFDGRSLAGWKETGSPGKWKIDNGALVGAPGAGRLVWQGAELEDFSVQFECLVDRGARGFLIYRNQPEDARSGYRVQLGDGDGKSPWKNGRMSYRRANGTESQGGGLADMPADGKWHHYHIHVRGTHQLRNYVDGRLVGNTSDATFPRGGLILEAPRDGALRIRNLELRVPLSAAATPEPAALLNQRQIAEQIVKQGGWATLLYGDKTQSFSAEPLPAENFEIKSIGFRSDSPISDETFQQWPVLPKLTFIDVDGPALSDRGLLPLARQTALRDVYLGGTRLTDDGLKVLARLPDLRLLDVHYTQVTDAGLTALNDARLLYCVGLDGRQLSPQSSAVLAAIPDLGEIRLSGPDVTDEKLALLAGLPEIAKVLLFSTQVTEAGLSAICEKEASPHLETVFVFGGQLDAAAIERVKAQHPGLTIALRTGRTRMP